MVYDCRGLENALPNSSRRESLFSTSPFTVNSKVCCRLSFSICDSFATSAFICEPPQYGRNHCHCLARRRCTSSYRALARLAPNPKRQAATSKQNGWWNLDLEMARLSNETWAKYPDKPNPKAVPKAKQSKQGSCAFDGPILECGVE